MATTTVTMQDGTKQDAESILEPWIKRRDAARKARRPFEGQWMTNAAFAAGKQWSVYIPRDHRVLKDPRREASGRSMQTVDMLTQYLMTAVGKFCKDDFQPQLLFQHNDEEGQEYTKAANKAFGWGWDEEWSADEIILDLFNTLVVFGTGAIRCRYDRTRGPLIGDVPYAPEGGYTYQPTDGTDATQYEAGKPILDLPAARDYMSSAKYYGEDVTMKPLHEGAVVWELLSPWNLLPPPAVEHERDFPWDLIVRPVHIDDLKAMYGDKAAEVKPDALEAMNVLGLKDLSGGFETSEQGRGQSAESAAKLDDHVLVYTGFKRPDVDYPRGHKIIFTQDQHLLDFAPKLDYQEAPHGPRSGLTYFHYWKTKQRFWARAMIEPGIGPQRILNKRESQNDEIIDRALPKTYVEEGAITDVPSGLPMEQVTMKPGATKPLIDEGAGPGPWMNQSRQDQIDNIERALGLHGVSLGQTDSASAPYARIALESENDTDKLDPIGKRFKLALANVSTDSLESMRQWPDGKLCLIVGEDDSLEAFTFERSMIPAPFMVKPPKGSALPRSQGAELQKINDLWSAAVASGAVTTNPIAWMEWYKDSLDAGKALDLPGQSLVEQQKHKAALENVVMLRTGQVLPVAPYDDPNTHIPEHQAEVERLSEALVEAPEDQTLIAGLNAIQQHVLAHQQSMIPPTLPPTGGPPQAPPLIPGGPPAGGPMPPSEMSAPPAPNEGH